MELLRNLYLGRVNIENLESERLEIMKLFEKTKREAPTPLQDLFEYSLIRSVADKLEKDLETISQSQKFPEKILLGSLPIGQMNTLVLPGEQLDEHIILFQSGLFGLLNLLASVVHMLGRIQLGAKGWA